MWPCAARSAPPWLGLRRVRAGGGGGGEAGGCGRECRQARGARGRRARRASPAPPLAGPAARPRAALFLAAVVVSPGRCPRPRALCLSPLPPATLPLALCFPALGALSDPSRPASLLHLVRSAVFPPVPLCCAPLCSVLSDLPQPRDQVSVF